MSEPHTLVIGRVGMDPAEGWRAVWRQPGSPESPALILDAFGITREDAVANLQRKVYLLLTRIDGLREELLRDRRK